MHHPLRRIKRLAFLGHCLLIPLLSQPVRIANRIDDSRRVPLPASIHPKARVENDQGPVDQSMRIEWMTIAMKPTAEQQAALEKLLADQQDRSSPSYHRWLTPEQFGGRFGLNSSDCAAIVSWLAAHGLKIETVARARNWITFSGTAQQVQRTFRTEIHRYLANGEIHFANAEEIQIPEALQDLVSEVRGLNDFQNSFPRVEEPRYTTSSGSHQLAPDDWTTIYDVKRLYQMGIDGTGQRVAILGRSDMDQTFVNAFRNANGLPPSVVEQHLIGPDPGITNAANEAALDVEWSGAIAPKATVVYVYANNFNLAAQAAVDQNLAPVMSESFSTCEPQAAAGLRSIALQANAQGITWLASSGDSGGAGCDAHGFFGVTNNSTLASGGLAVSVPASFPEVTAVGGTQFNEGSGQYWSATNNANGGSALSYIPETVWNETGAGGLLASGGGSSIYFVKPAWQRGPGVPNDNTRDVPDISFSAAGNHDPYMVINANGQRATGGTSASSPSFAGVVALLNQYAVQQGWQTEPGLGNINPQLYRLAQTFPNAFHDITQGDNKVPCMQASPDCSSGTLGFTAGAGYDLATGLGSADVYNLVTQWNTATASTTTQVSAAPTSITVGDTLQLTAAVTGSTDAVPTGTVAFTAGPTVLGIAPIVDADGGALATLTVTGPQLPAGSTPVTATYSGDSIYNGSRGQTVVNVAAAGSHSHVVLSIAPNPARAGQTVRVTLRELNGVATTITGWTINGNDDSVFLLQDFGTTALAPGGTLSTSIQTVGSGAFPQTRLYVFTGHDADGQPWSQQFVLTLVAPQSGPELQLASIPAAVQPNPAADPSCQWTHQLILQDQNGLAVQLTRLLANGADWSAQIQQLFGTNRLAPLGMIQAKVCWAQAPSSVTYELDGIDQNGSPVEAFVTTSFAGPSSTAGAFSVVYDAPSSTVQVNAAPGQAWSASVLPATAQWLSLNPSSGIGPQTIHIGAVFSVLGPAVFNATLVFQAQDAVPQFIEQPIALTLGPPSDMHIAGVANGASFQQIFAPGMILSVFGTDLAAGPQSASTLPLPLSLGGVSATVNGVPAPLYYVSAAQLNTQIPYETGAGPAVLGVINNGQAAAYTFQVAPFAPGIFTSAGALVPSSSGKPGDTLPLFITGEGTVFPSLATGASPFSETPLAALPRPLGPVTVTVAGVAAEISFAGIPPGLVGVTQINFVIPPNAPPGPQPVIVSAGGIQSQAAQLTVVQ
ncbi:MAG TPA: protease pro-enzyme activation domain-containing protein [Bryobacteraceae bacterium]|nr:protease pro-enzyme activation domain-containing protein [Bryobacteraceae bacterium]